MSARLVGERREAVADERGSSVGRSPCRLTMSRASPSGSSREHGLEYAVGARRVIGTRHHGLAAGAADRIADGLASVATTTRPHSASMARRQTWTIIGSPAMSASGLSGSRVAFSRAGITMRQDVMVLCQ